MDPMTLMSLMQMGMNASQGFGAALGTGGSSAWGNALSGSIAGGFLSGRGAKKAKRKAQKRFKRALDTTQSIQGRGLQQQEALSRQATQQRLSGYDAAKRETERMGRASKQQALDSETQLTGRLSQGLQNRGLGSTTVGSNLQRGIAADTSRQFQGINEGLAQAFGNLAMGRSGVEAEGTRDLAGIAGQQSDLSTQLAQMRLLGGATLGSTGNFDPGSWTQGYMPNTQSGAMEGLGSLMGSMGGGDQNAQLMAMLQKLFSQGGGMGGGQGFQYPGTMVGAPIG